jgi:hypothetical protein
MTIAGRAPSPMPLDFGEYREIVERYTDPRRIDCRKEFRGWLKTAILDFGEKPPDHFSGSSLSNLYPQIWKIAVDCAERFCPECREELGETAPVILSPATSREEYRKPWEELLKRLRTAYALTTSPVESDAERLATYVQNFSSRGHKAMVIELWTKGYASNQRLANLRGKYGVTAHADRNAIYRLVTKAELLWTKERQIRITKERSGLALEKCESRESGPEETSGFRPSSSLEIDCRRP